MKEKVYDSLDGRKKVERRTGRSIVSGMNGGRSFGEGGRNHLRERRVTSGDGEREEEEGGKRPLPSQPPQRHSRRKAQTNTENGDKRAITTEKRSRMLQNFGTKDYDKVRVVTA